MGFPDGSVVNNPLIKLIQLLWKMVWRFLKKLGLKPPYNPALPLLGIYPEATKIEKDACTTMSIAALFTTSRIWKQPRCPSTVQCSSVQSLIVSNSLRPHGLQHTRPPCSSPISGVYPNLCPLSWWCHPTISSSVVPFSSHLQCFPASGYFQMSQLFASGGQNIGVSTSTSVLPINTSNYYRPQFILDDI